MVWQSMSICIQSDINMASQSLIREDWRSTNVSLNNRLTSKTVQPRCVQLRIHHFKKLKKGLQQDLDASFQIIQMQQSVGAQMQEACRQESKQKMEFCIFTTREPFYILCILKHFDNFGSKPTRVDGQECRMFSDSNKSSPIFKQFQTQRTRHPIFVFGYRSKAT